MDSEIEGRIRKLWEAAFNGRELDVLDEITSPEFVNHNALPGTPRGPEGHRQVVERLWTALPDAHFELEHLGSDGDTVICIGTMSGTHRGTLLGVPATGTRVQWRQCHMYRFDATGRAIEHDAIRNDVSLLRQFAEGGDPAACAVRPGRGHSTVRRDVSRSQSPSAHSTLRGAPKYSQPRTPPVRWDGMCRAPRTMDTPDRVCGRADSGAAPRSPRAPRGSRPRRATP
jgi:predicted ester cyclase